MVLDPQGVGSGSWREIRSASKDPGGTVQGEISCHSWKFLVGGLPRGTVSGESSIPGLIAVHWSWPVALKSPQILQYHYSRCNAFSSIFCFIFQPAGDTVAEKEVGWREMVPPGARAVVFCSKVQVLEWFWLAWQLLRCFCNVCTRKWLCHFGGLCCKWQ